MMATDVWQQCIRIHWFQISLGLLLFVQCPPSICLAQSWTSNPFKPSQSKVEAISPGLSRSIEKGKINAIWASPHFSLDLATRVQELPANEVLNTKNPQTLASLTDAINQRLPCRMDRLALLDCGMSTDSTLDSFPADSSCSLFDYCVAVLGQEDIAMSFEKTGIVFYPSDQQRYVPRVYDVSSILIRDLPDSGKPTSEQGVAARLSGLVLNEQRRLTGHSKSSNSIRPIEQLVLAIMSTVPAEWEYDGGGATIEPIYPVKRPQTTSATRNEIQMLAICTEYRHHLAIESFLLAVSELQAQR